MYETFTKRDLSKSKIICFIISYTIKYGFAPTVRNIADYMNKSVSDTYKLIKEMLEDGILTQGEGSNKARTLHVVGTTVKLVYNDGTEIIPNEI